ncbi:AraC family transcriptional regulator [Chitinasiproducens palmae]|uniref:AraC-type DNA-binding protein n=1 Tax=Chitinasiproducens palmae TaxID=1770053 RepID=A0A1H2PJ43_9BURK|nr:helix-turn-helix transcriptional regulator [Chitinasiproducens palmae]SDV46313.1 AraC-type DNA-binding protein [Chitinasiproducens palmae]
MTGSCVGQLARFDPDVDHRPAVGLRIEFEQNDAEQPVHCHRKGQLVLALRGAVTCEVPKAMWMVPPHHAVWIPGGMPHSNHATDNARVCFLFVEPEAAELPTQCCTLAISPLVRELILYLADQGPSYAPSGPISRLVTVLLEQLVTAPVEQLHLPTSGHPNIRRIADALAADPADRTTLAEWAERSAMSGRSLARLVERETGLTFGRWRQQLHLIVALRQLAAGATVQQVAGHLGYDSVTAFITMFKKALGQPPAQYFASLR